MDGADGADGASRVANKPTTVIVTRHKFISRFRNHLLPARSIEEESTFEFAFGFVVCWLGFYWKPTSVCIAHSLTVAWSEKSGQFD